MNNGLELCRDLIIAPTLSTFGIEFLYSKGILKFSGKSYPDNSGLFFDPLLAWVDNLINSGHKKIRVEFAVSYFNTSSSKYLFQIMLRLKQYQQQGKQLDFVWHLPSNDEETAETWKEIMEELQLEYTMSNEAFHE